MIAIRELDTWPGENVGIISTNRDEYPPYEVPIDGICIIGQVIWFASQLVRDE